MGLEIKQSLKLSQQLVMTPQLQQAIKLLQLSRLELAETINQELLENPMLEATEENLQDQEQDQREAAGEPSLPENAASPAGDTAPGDLPSPEAELTSSDEVQMSDQVREDFDWENYLGEYSSGSSSEESSIYEEHEAPPYENVISKNTSLREHLLWQLRLSPLEPEQMSIGQVIVGSIEPDGYLRTSLEELAAMAETTLAEVELVLKTIQQFDPLGVGARDLRECLLIQAVELYPAEDLVHTILEDFLDQLEKKNYRGIAKKSGATLEEVAEAVDLIRRLNPRPGGSLGDDDSQYITPDINISKVEGNWVISLNEDGLPKLRVNNFYRDALATGADPQAKEYVQGKLRGALWLIRSIHQRQRTIYKVTESILKFQRDFFERGIAHLKPLVLRDVAEDVGMHESTISRVTTNKYVGTPQGVFELKFFFNSGINRVHGEAVASEAVKERIRQIIAAENPASPLSDEDIAGILKKENIDIARRTVAKYRVMLGILSSNQRRETLGEHGKKK
ncbi:MAG: RNA polymerase factor sigma-54 [Deltaproteobacteria bacterium]|nr:RNA polymerase factor sigma-54 [Deltaproteobacteria bacterium]